jgi:tellurite methyltransferase
MPDAPATWLVENLHYIPRKTRVLDVASGRGRNAIYVASAGWPVHAVDRDALALAGLAEDARARGVSVTTEVVDLETGAVSFGLHVFGGVIVFNYLHRPLMPAVVDAVAVGGVLIYETFTRGQALRGHPRNPAFLLQDGELPQLVQPLRVIRAREGEFDGKLVASVVATRV